MLATGSHMKLAAVRVMAVQGVSTFIEGSEAGVIEA